MYSSDWHILYPFNALIGSDVLITNSFEALLLTEFLWLYFINHLPVILRRECF